MYTNYIIYVFVHLVPVYFIILQAIITSYTIYSRLYNYN